MFNVYIAPVPSHIVGSWAYVAGPWPCALAATWRGIVGICGWPLALRPGGHLARRMHPHNYHGSRDSMPVVAQRSDGSGLQGELLTHRRLVHSHRDHQAQGISSITHRGGFNANA